jgi:solute:Na+ symporter, SSS family
MRLVYSLMLAMLLGAMFCVPAAMGQEDAPLELEEGVVYEVVDDTIVSSAPVPEEADEAADPEAPVEVASGNKMMPLDWGVVAAYFGILLLLAWWVIRQNKNTADDYFLAGRNLGWFVIGASIFASNIGSEHLVGLAGSGCTDGVAMAHFELHAWCLLVLAWILIPFYTRSKVFTMPEFLEKRFSPVNRWVLSLISLTAYVLTKIAVGIFAGGIVFSTLLPELQIKLGGTVIDSFWIGSVLVIVMTGLYTAIGGFRAVAYTEALQTVILIVGSALVTLYGLWALGDLNDGDGSLAAGWDNLRTEVGSEMFNLWKPLVPDDLEGTWEPIDERDTAKAEDETPDNEADPTDAEASNVESNATGEQVPGELIEVGDEDGETSEMEIGAKPRIAWYFNHGGFPWLGMLFCAPIIGLWYWCTDQYIVQRALGAPNETQARRGSIFAAFLKLLPVFIFIIPGMICLALATTHNSCGLDKVLLDPSGNPIPKECQGAFPLMVKHVLPTGIRGIVVAGLLSALMSSLAGVFNASSTLFTMDFYSKFRKKASQPELVWVGRIATLVMILIGLAWLPIIRGAEGLYFYLQSVQGYLAPPIFAVFFFGVFFKRLNSKGCLAALLVGFALGLFRLGVDTSVQMLGHTYDTGTFLWIINHIYFQYYSLFIFIVSTAVLFLVSAITKAPDLEKISGLTYATVDEEHKAESRKSWGVIDIVASLAVLAAIVAAYIYFSG